MIGSQSLLSSTASSASVLELIFSCVLTFFLIVFRYGQFWPGALPLDAIHLNTLFQFKIPLVKKRHSHPFVV